MENRKLKEGTELVNEMLQLFEERTNSKAPQSEFDKLLHKVSNLETKTAQRSNTARRPTDTD